MAKRPTGFGKASKQKKHKSEESPKPEENDAELNVELSEDIEDEELAEIYGLYTKLQEQRDPKVARGLIHECDQMSRARDSQNQVSPDKFHVVYGGALLTSANPTVEEADPKQFRDAGVERINVGSTSADDETVALAVLELVQYAHTQLKDGELTSAGLKILKHAIALLKKRSAQDHVELGKTASKMLQLIEELSSTKREFRDESAEVSYNVLNTQIKSLNDDTRRWGHKGLGQYYSTLAAPELAELEDEDDELHDEEVENKTTRNNSADDKSVNEVKAQVEKALSHLRQSLSDTDQESYVMLAETSLTMAGLENSDDNPKYVEALKYLKKARLLGNDSLNDVIESLEVAE